MRGKCFYLLSYYSNSVIIYSIFPGCPQPSTTHGTSPSSVSTSPPLVVLRLSSLAMNSTVISAQSSNKQQLAQLAFPLRQSYKCSVILAPFFIPSVLDKSPNHHLIRLKKQTMQLTGTTVWRGCSSHRSSVLSSSLGMRKLLPGEVPTAIPASLAL